MESEMLKGHLDVVLLSVLEAGPAHGYAVIEAIRLRSDGTFDLPEGTIYPALHRLEGLGLLASKWETADSGRRRRVYSLTRLGVKTLRQRRAFWARFSSAIGSLLQGGA
jgi:transcriptional regulator